MFFCIVWYSMYSMFDNFECRLKRKPFDVTSVEQLIEHVWSHMINLTGTCSFATPGQYIALRSNKVANCKSHECVFAIRESVPCENPSKVDYPIYTIHLDNQGLWFNTTKHNQLGIPLLCFEYKCQRSKYRITCQMYAGWLDVIDWCSSLYHPMSMCIYIYILFSFICCLSWWVIWWMHTCAYVGCWSWNSGGSWHIMTHGGSMWAAYPPQRLSHCGLTLDWQAHISLPIQNLWTCHRPHCWYIEIDQIDLHSQLRSALRVHCFQIIKR